MSRLHYAEVHVRVVAKADITSRVLRPAQAFLEWAKKLAGSAERMDWNLSIVAAMAACEIATERTIVGVARASGKENLVGASRNRFKHSFKMQNPDASDLFRSLTGDDIKLPEAEWEEFDAAVKHRNAVIHDGEQKKQDDAKVVSKIATRFVERLEKHWQ